MKYLPGVPSDFAAQSCTLSQYQARHFDYEARLGVAHIMLARPEKKNPLSFESYAELRDLFRAMQHASDISAIVISGKGENFCSGGDVHEIIGPLTKMDMPSILQFTRLTGDLVLAMRECPQAIVAAIDGVCAGAGAIIAMASDLRLGTERSATAFLFNRVGLAGCDMGACAILPRLIGQGRASELLLTGRNLGGVEAERWGFLNRLCPPQTLLDEAFEVAHQIAKGPRFANGMTKKMLHQEWSQSIPEALESEAQAQAICMMTNDFHRAYHAFANRQKPVFQGN